MIHEQRVRRMARMAAYEQTDGKRDKRITSYFRSDYLTRQILITMLCDTLAFVIAAAMYAVYHFETLIVDIYDSDLRLLVMGILMRYLVFIVIMIAVTIAVYMSRYSRARSHIGAYYHDLAKLSNEYRSEQGEHRRNGTASGNPR